jgi:hypothetical protein
MGILLDDSNKGLYLSINDLEFDAESYFNSNARLTLSKFHIFIAEQDRPFSFSKISPIYQNELTTITYENKGLLNNIKIKLNDDFDHLEDNENALTNTLIFCDDYIRFFHSLLSFHLIQNATFYSEITALFSLNPSNPESPTSTSPTQTKPPKIHPMEQAKLSLNNSVSDLRQTFNNPNSKFRSRSQSEENFNMPQNKVNRTLIHRDRGINLDSFEGRTNYHKDFVTQNAFIENSCKEKIRK